MTKAEVLEAVKAVEVDSELRPVKKAVVEMLTKTLPEQSEIEGSDMVEYTQVMLTEVSNMVEALLCAAERVK